MASRFGAEDEEDVLAPKEPQVSSEDPTERKVARALRIKKRQEALKRAEQPLDEVVHEEAPGPVELATARAVEDLQRLSSDGTAQVTNVKVTTDERECIRRLHLTDNLRIAYERMEEEAAASQVSYEAITSNWDKMLQIKDPLDAQEAIQQQRQKCDDLLARKEALINYLKQDLKKMDDDYYEGLDSQDREIKELSDRIENQMIIMQKAYEKQLYLLDQATVIEREAMVNHNNKRWNALYKQREKEELQHIDYKCEQLETFKQEMDTIMWDHYDKYREAKIELESLINELQKELEKLKSTCLINGEKIAYNYQILKKREEENVFVRSQQKRKLNKMSDVVNGLRAKIRRAAEDGALEELRSNDEIQKLLQAMEDLEKKSEHFSQVNDYKFWQVWRMSVAKCGQLARELRHVEAALHAQVLAEPAPPAPPLPKPIAVPTGEENAPTKHEEKSESNEFAIESDDAVTMQAKQKLMQHILQLVADNTGFLLEDRLLKLIEKYQSNSRNLCTLDGIFMALEIQSAQDIDLLLKVFLKYAFCPACEGVEGGSEQSGEKSESSSSQDSGRDVVTENDSHKIRDKPSIRSRASTGRSTVTTTSRSVNVMTVKTLEMSPSDQELITEADEIMQKYHHPKMGFVAGGASTVGALSSSTGVRGARGITLLAMPSQDQQLARPTSPQNAYMCPVGHHLQIEPVQVLNALCEFIQVFVPPEKQELLDILDSVKPREYTSPSRRLKPEDIDEYWNRWKNVYPPEKDKFWDCLMTGLNNYLHMLQERERLHEELVVLRRRNAALRRLMAGALPQLAMSQRPRSRRWERAFTAPAEDRAPESLPPI